MHLAHDCLDQIVRHACEADPVECFGFLVGRYQRTAEVLGVIRGTNTASRPEHEYLMDAAEFLQVEESAERCGWQVIGFYHSHPEGDTRPSVRDMAAFWIDYVYLIVGLSQGKVSEVSVWRLSSGVTDAVQDELTHLKCTL